MMGDSIAPMGLSVYEVTESLKGIGNYTHVNPIEFINSTSPIGTQSFTGRNSTYRTVSYTAEDYSTRTYREY